MKIGNARNPILSVKHNDDGTVAILLNRGYSRTADVVPFMIVDTDRISICIPPATAIEMSHALVRDDSAPIAQLLDLVREWHRERQLANNSIDPVEVADERYGQLCDQLAAFVAANLEQK